MDIRPILSTLLRHKTAATLIVLEIALSCAIICNAIFLITTRLERMERPTGLAETELVSIQMAGIGRSDDPDALVKRDLAALRAIPGVEGATSTNQVPFGGSSSNSSISLEPDQRNPTAEAAVYLADEGLLDTFGLKLVEGRWFNSDEFLDYGVLDDPGPETPISATVLTRSLADRLFPGESAIGKSIYSWGEAPTRVVGVVEYLMRPNDIGGPAENQFSFILPIRPTFGTFALRTAPER
ncbi:MAG: ABC transporter permease, partial [Lysobacter spongiicola]|nr:ABC transporter permease [Lysobacter spongiicola]